MDHNEMLNRIAQSEIVPIVTVRDLSEGIALIDRLVEAGADVIEIELRTPDTPPALKAAPNRYLQCLFAAGTVLDEEVCTWPAQQGRIS